MSLVEGTGTSIKPTESPEIGRPAIGSEGERQAANAPGESKGENDEENPVLPERRGA